MIKKSILTVFGILLLITSVSSQQIDISGMYSNATASMFKNSWGYNVGYNQIIKKNRLGLSFRYFSNNNEYDEIYSANDDVYTKIMYEHKPENKRISIDLNYSYRLIGNEKSNVYLGCNASLNYFHIKGEKSGDYNADSTLYEYSYDYTVNNKFGFGFLIEYEICKIISDRISTSIKINPEFNIYDWGQEGGYDPWLIGWLNFSVALKYRFTD